MKTKIFSVLIVFVLLIGFLAGCSNFTPPKTGPSLNAMVTGNGGMTVQKGNYLYFVNGFVKSGDLKEGDNEYGKVKNGAIYRAELDAEGNLQYDAENNLTKIELIIPKLVGFENGGFYIFDNYIYYATPTILKDRTGKVRFDLVDFYMAKLDGTGIKKIYATSEYSTSASFAFYKLENEVQLVVFDGTKVVSVAVNGTKIGSPVTMVESATSVALPKVTDYNRENHTVLNLNKYVYYTRALKESDEFVLELGNVLAKVQIGTKIEEKLMQDNMFSYSLGSVKNNALYYSKSSANVAAKFYFRSLLEPSFIGANETQLTGTNYSSITQLDFQAGSSRGVVVASDSQLIYVKDVFIESGMELLVNEKVTLLFSKGDYVYYTYGTKNRLARVNVISKTIENLTSEEDEFKVDVTLKVDYDNEYVYLYKKHTNKAGSSYYLERVQYATTNFTSNFIGVMLEKHMPDEVEEA